MWPTYRIIYNRIQDFKRCWPTHRTIHAYQAKAPLLFPMQPSELPRALYEHAYVGDPPCARDIEHFSELNDHIPLRSISKLLRTSEKCRRSSSDDHVTWEQVLQLMGRGGSLAGGHERTNTRRPLVFAETTASSHMALPSCNPFALPDDPSRLVTPKTGSFA